MSPVKSSKDETIRLFKSNFFEFFTRVHWSVPLVLFVPLVGYCLYAAAVNPKSGWETLLIGLGVGAFSWSLLEYFLHRFVFHFKPRGKRFQKFFYLIHEVHHEYPQDSFRLVMPPVESIPLAILFWFVLRVLIPDPFFYPFFAGLVLGYLSYDMTHYAVHHLPMRGKLGNFLKHHHLKHHFKNEKKGYGVSSPFWDWVFHT